MDTKSKTHEANPQKGFVVQINASENFGLVAWPDVLDLLEAEGFELSLCLTLTMTRRVASDALRF